ncbi:hypothetical protein BHOIPH791_05060 [Bartonella henselae]|uniref:hypothetical protein n=1 Tax=Bartonella henselae TaxID=38323 RepID=UPI0003DFA5B6|nr:hypothetical protein Q654_01333 [Bartonella henselae JK 50]ETS07744.1 hypothetical protein Q655_01285 [Bartonella henselae JK 51]OLL46849.1 hypothetical protein AT242_06840 [Bartonella henselae]GFF01953.1 hypothetical protein BH623125_03870 [Bartonella henselae]GFF04360.1 hypothetical protein BH80429_11810 [Bartonella henselae]
MSTFLNARITADGNYKKRVLFILDEVDLHGYRNILKGRSFYLPEKRAKMNKLFSCKNIPLYDVVARSILEGKKC